MFQHYALSSYALTCALLILAEASQVWADPRVPGEVRQEAARARIRVLMPGGLSKLAFTRGVNKSCYPHVCMYVYVHICINVYIYIYIHIHTCVYIYIYIYIICNVYRAPVQYI